MKYSKDESWELTESLVADIEDLLKHAPKSEKKEIAFLLCKGIAVYYDEDPVNMMILLQDVIKDIDRDMLASIGEEIIKVAKKDKE